MMGRSGLTAMTKVEVVVRGADAHRVKDLLVAAGVTGYTALSNVSGLGHHGYHEGRLLFNDEAVLDLILTVIDNERAEAIVAGLRELFEERPGVMFVSDVFVSRPDYFR